MFSSHWLGNKCLCIDCAEDCPFLSSPASQCKQPHQVPARDIFKEARARDRKEGRFERVFPKALVRSLRPATGVSQVLRSHVSRGVSQEWSVPQSVPPPRVECPTGCSPPESGVSHRVSPPESGVSHRVSPGGPSGPRLGHSLGHPRSRKHSRGHSPGHSRLNGPRDPCSWSAGSQSKGPFLFLAFLESPLGAWKSKQHPAIVAIVVWSRACTFYWWANQARLSFRSSRWNMFGAFVHAKLKHPNGNIHNLRIYPYPMVWPLLRPWSETMVSDPLWAQKTLEIKGFLGVERPFLDLVSQTPRPRGGGRPLFAEILQVKIGRGQKAIKNQHAVPDHVLAYPLRRNVPAQKKTTKFSLAVLLFAVF